MFWPIAWLAASVLVVALFCRFFMALAKRPKPRVAFKQIE